MTKDEALKLALEALHGFIPYLPLNDEVQCGRYDKAITAIKETLAHCSFDYKEHAEGLQRDYDLLLAEYNLLKQEQKPVAYLCENAVGHKYFRWKKPSSTYKPIALYTKENT